MISVYWKKTALASFGYTMRNLIDAQLRAAILGSRMGFSSAFNRPTDYIMWSIGRAGKQGSRIGKGGIAGEDWDDIRDAYLAQGLDPLEGAAYEYASSLERAGGKLRLSPDEVLDENIRTGNAVIATLDVADAASVEKYVTGVIDMAARVNKELGVRLAAQGYDTTYALQMVKADPEYMQELKGLWRNEFIIKRNKSMGRDYVRTVKDIDSEFDELFTIWYERAVQERVEFFKSGQNQDLMLAVAFGRTRPRRGADVFLYDDEFLDEFGSILTELGMTTLIEVHDVDNLLRMTNVVGFPHASYSLLGINNRDLRTMKTSLEHSMRLAEMLEDTSVLVSESGIRTPDDLARLRAHGIHIALVGEHLMKQPDPGAALRELLA
jgi:hypothetical protein